MVPGVLSVTPPSGGVNWYEFSDDVTDSWENNDGTASGISYSTTYRTYSVSGDGSPKSAYFNGAGDYVQLYDADLINGMTFVFDYALPSGWDASSERIFWKGNTGGAATDSYGLARYSATNQVDFFIGCGGAAYKRYRTNDAIMQTDGGVYSVVIVINSKDDIEIWHDNVSYAVTNYGSGTCSAFLNTARPLMLGIDEYYTTSNDYQGIIDNFQVYDKALSSTEISNIKACGQIECSIDTANFQLTAINKYDDSGLSTFWAKVDATNYSTINGTIITNLFQNSTTLHNITYGVVSSNNQFFQGSLINVNISSDIQLNMTQRPLIRLINEYNSSYINDFTFAYKNPVPEFGDFEEYSTSNSYLYLTASVFGYEPSIITSDFLTVSLNENSTYNNNTLYEYNTSEVKAKFTATKLISGSTVTNFNVTIEGNTKNNSEYFNLNAGSYNVTFSKTDYFSKTVEFNFTTGTIQTYTITGVYDQIINITAYDVINSTVISSFNISISGVDYTYESSDSTSTGYIEYGVISGEVNLTFSSSGYETKTVSLNPSSIIYNYTFYVYTQNSINLTFRDEQTGNIIDDVSIDIDIYSSVYNTNLTTSNGYAYVDFLTPSDYTIVITPNNTYSAREYYLTISPYTHNELVIYLLNGTVSEDVLINVVDENGAKQEGVTVKVYKFYVYDNELKLISSLKTDSDGEVTFDLELNGPKYSFIVLKNGEVVYESQDSYKITKNEITLVIKGNNQFDSNWFRLATSNYRIQFNEDTNNFTFDCVSDEFLNIRLNVFSINNSILDDYLYSYGTQTMCGNTIKVNVDNTTGSSYEAKAYAYIGSQYVYLGSLRQDFTSTPTQIEYNGWIISAIVLVVIAFMGLWNPQVMLLLMGLAIITFKLTALINIGWSIVYALCGLFVFIGFVIGDKE